MMMTLEQTYKAVLLKEMFREEREEWKAKVDAFLQKGIVKKNTTLRIVLSTMGASAFIFFLLNSTVRPMRELFIWFPLFFFMGGCVALSVLLGFRVYNAIKKRINVLKGKRDREFLNCFEFAKAAEHNYATIEKALNEKCTIPGEFQNKKVLEAMILFIRQGRAANAEQAMRIIRKEFPYMLSK
ncbi:hypothetical protein D5F11_022965 [Siminovitchia terrae]|uniref:Uncharacterized protein n=1 Tax=Siminovitchia terrae TaxID=1914933 RepID=A0A429X1X0_SIMTE|nr:hypothetical protein [Siminovitchia terrae]RST57373.1 hypothetical protein D5F11_022965 [Siminovitchia terrae]